MAKPLQLSPWASTAHPLLSEDARSSRTRAQLHTSPLVSGIPPIWFSGAAPWLTAQLGAPPHHGSLPVGVGEDSSEALKTQQDSQGGLRSMWV